MKEMRFRVSLHDAGLWIHITRPNLYVTSHVDDWFFNEFGTQAERRGELLSIALLAQFSCAGVHIPGDIHA
jgi:hypothetical protein